MTSRANCASVAISRLRDVCPVSKSAPNAMKAMTGGNLIAAGMTTDSQFDLSDLDYLSDLGASSSRLKS
jgi:hypothetical protein